MPRFLKLGGTPRLLLLSEERGRYELQDELGKDRVSVHRIPKANHALIIACPLHRKRTLDD